MNTCSTNGWRRLFGSPRRSRCRRFFWCPFCPSWTDRRPAGRDPTRRDRSVLQRGDVAGILPELLGLQHSAHDLARASLGERVDNLDFLRNRILPQFILALILHLLNEFWTLVKA